MFQELNLEEQNRNSFPSLTINPVVQVPEAEWHSCSCINYLLPLSLHLYYLIWSSWGHCGVRWKGTGTSVYPWGNMAHLELWSTFGSLALWNLSYCTHSTSSLFFSGGGGPTLISPWVTTSSVIQRVAPCLFSRNCYSPKDQTSVSCLQSLYSAHQSSLWPLRSLLKRKLPFIWNNLKMWHDFKSEFKKQAPCNLDVEPAVLRKR